MFLMFLVEYKIKNIISKEPDSKCPSRDFRTRELGQGIVKQGNWVIMPKNFNYATQVTSFMEVELLYSFSPSYFTALQAVFFS